MADAIKARAAAQRIQWDNYNYPPLLKVIHYDPTELETEKAKAVRWMHRPYQLLHVVLAWQMLSWIVIAATGHVRGSGFNIILSLLNVIVLLPLALYLFYNGYRGIATNNPSSVFTYQAGYSGIALLSFIFMLLGSPNAPFNGWPMLRWSATITDAGTRNFWTAAIIIEALLWLGMTVLSCYGVYLAQQYRTGSVRKSVASSVVRSVV